MINIEEEFGRNAGKVWHILNTQGPLGEGRLMNSSMLNENSLYAAIGWLARENKIRKDVSVYRLGATNLVNKIGDDAGKIWNILITQKEVDIPTLGKTLSQTAQIDEKDVYAALGWLAQEGKIETKSILRPKNL